jgi:transposase InsO family protein
VVDWFSRPVLAWRLSITLEVEFCIEAVTEARARHGKPDIFNTDQGSQFTSGAFTGLLLEHNIGPTRVHRALPTVAGPEKVRLAPENRTPLNRKSGARPAWRPLPSPLSHSRPTPR